MDIYRIRNNGIAEKITLSKEELYYAYREQQSNFDLEDVIFYIESYDEEYFFNDFGIKKCVIEPRINEVAYDIAREARTNVDKYGTDIDYEIGEAIHTIIEDLHLDQEQNGE